MTGWQGMSSEQAGKQAAADFRLEHGLGLQPLGDLVAIIEQATGIDVAVLDADREQHGLTMRDPKSGITSIGVARTRYPMRQRSTLAHELAHVIFGDWKGDQDFSARSPEEIRADAFARHLLIPEEALAAHLGQRESFCEADLSAVVQWFLVSPTMAAINLNRSGYIDAPTKEAWMDLPTPTLAARHGWSDHYRSLQEDSDRTRPPRRLLARAISGYAEGVVSAQTIATLRGIGANEVEAELADADIFPILPESTSMSASDLSPVKVDLSDLREGESGDCTK